MVLLKNKTSEIRTQLWYGNQPVIIKKEFFRTKEEPFLNAQKGAITDFTVNPYVGIIRIRFMGRGRTSSQQPFFNGITLPDIQFLNCVLL